MKEWHTCDLYWCRSRFGVHVPNLTPISINSAAVRIHPGKGKHRTQSHEGLENNWPALIGWFLGSLLIFQAILEKTNCPQAFVGAYVSSGTAKPRSASILGRDFGISIYTKSTWKTNLRLEMPPSPSLRVQKTIFFRNSSYWNKIWKLCVWNHCRQACNQTKLFGTLGPELTKPGANSGFCWSNCKVIRNGESPETSDPSNVCDEQCQNKWETMNTNI